MKHLFIHLFISILFVLSVHSQTKEETDLFNRINEHRTSLGLNKIVWDSSVYKMASHHTKYLTIICSPLYNKKLTHKEDFDIPEFEELSSLTDRIKKYMPIDQQAVLLIKIKGIDMNISFAENALLYIVPTDFKGIPKVDEFQMSKLAFNGWLTSKKHKKIMEYKDVKIGACSIQYFDMSYTIKAHTVKEHKRIASDKKTILIIKEENYPERTYVYKCIASVFNVH